MPEAHEAAYTMYLYSPLGQLVHEGNLSEKRSTVDIDHLPAGMYLLQIVNGQEQWQERLIID